MGTQKQKTKNVHILNASLSNLKSNVNHETRMIVEEVMSKYKISKKAAYWNLLEALRRTAVYEILDEQIEFQIKEEGLR